MAFHGLLCVNEVAHGCLKRQWEFIKEPDQSHILVSSVVFTIGTIYYCTCRGVQLGRELAKALCLKDEKKEIVILCGGGTGFLVGVGLSLTGNGLLIEHSNRMGKWKEFKINQVVTELMEEEFESDPILNQFMCPISQEPIHLPMRTPIGQVFDYNSLLDAADTNGMIKDIYNKRIPMPTEFNPQATHSVSYSVDACLKDSEMMIVIGKRFRHLATQKSEEPGLSISTAEFFLSYRNSLGNLVKHVYTRSTSKPPKKIELKSLSNRTKKRGQY